MSASIVDVASVAARTGGTVVRQVRAVIDPSAARPADGGQPPSGWLVVTVSREPSDIDTAQLTELGDGVEVRVRPAADAKGTEIAASASSPASWTSSPLAR